MRSERLSFVIAILAAIVSTAALAQHFDPPDPPNPTSSQQCDALADAWEARADYLQQQWNQCHQREGQRVNRECRAGSPEYDRCANSIGRFNLGGNYGRARCGDPGTLYYRCDSAWDEVTCARTRGKAAVDRCKVKAEENAKRDAYLAQQKAQRDALVAKEKEKSDAWKSSQAAADAQRQSEEDRRRQNADTTAKAIADAMKALQDKMTRSSDSPPASETEEAPAADLRPRDVPVGKADTQAKPPGVPGEQQKASLELPSFDELLGEKKADTVAAKDSGGGLPSFDELLSRGDSGTEVSAFERGMVDTLLEYGGMTLTFAGIPLGIAGKAFAGELGLIDTATSAIENFERLDTSFADRDFTREFGQKFLDPGEFLLVLASNSFDERLGRVEVPRVKSAIGDFERAWKTSSGPSKGTETVVWWTGGSSRMISWEPNTVVWAPRRGDLEWADKWWVRGALHQARRDSVEAFDTLLARLLERYRGGE